MNFDSKKSKHGTEPFGAFTCVCGLAHEFMSAVTKDLLKIWLKAIKYNYRLLRIHRFRH